MTALSFYVKVTHKRLPLQLKTENKQLFTIIQMNSGIIFLKSLYRAQKNLLKEYVD